MSPNETVEPEADPLGVDRYVQALADHVLDRQVQAPFAVGVFGGWGSGKSHFLRQFNARLRSRTEGAPASPDWHNNVVYVHFNAWHYAEADLWASLISRLFEALAEHRLGRSAADDPAAVAAERRRLLAQISVAQSEEAEAEATLRAADARLSAAAQALADKQATIDRSSTGLRLIAATTVGAMTEVLRRSLDQTQPRTAGPNGEPQPGYDWRAGRPAAPPVPEAWASMTEKLRTVSAEVELLNAARALLGQPELRDGADARATITVLQGGAARGKALVRSLLSRELRVEKIALLTMVMLMPFMAVWVIGQLSPSGAVMSWWMAALQTWGKAGAGVLGMIGTAFTFWQSAITPRMAQLDKYAAALPAAARAGEAAVDSAAELSDRIDEIVAERRALLTERAAAERQALQQAEAEREDLLAQLSASRAAQAADQAALDALRAGARLDRFLADTTQGGAYSSRLGFLTTIRRDLERLDALLVDLRAPEPPPEAEPEAAPEAEPDAAAEARSSAGAEPGAPIDDNSVAEDLPAPSPEAEPPAPRPGADLRVVLAIDDLDRCPPERVVDVLQAIHLLLATPLFVVLVAVDPDALLRSIHAQRRRLLAPDAPTAGGEAAAGPLDPQRYLEKIIQIPFQVPPLGPEGYAALVRRDLRPRPAADPATAPATDPAASVGSATEAAEPAAARAPIEGEELAFLLELWPLSPSPRAARRLVEVYRLARPCLRLEADAPENSAEDALLQARRALALCLGLGFAQPGALRRLRARIDAAPPTGTLSIEACLQPGAPAAVVEACGRWRLPTAAFAAAWPVAARFSYSPEEAG